MYSCGHVGGCVDSVLAVLPARTIDLHLVGTDGTVYMGMYKKIKYWNKRLQFIAHDQTHTHTQRALSASASVSVSDIVESQTYYPNALIK